MARPTAKALSKGAAMSIPLWVYRIWNHKNAEPLKTYRAEASKLERYIDELSDEMQIDFETANEHVGLAWALYVYADPPVYDEATKFPLSSFIETGRGFVVSAVEKTGSRAHVIARGAKGGNFAEGAWVKAFRLV
jgi:hypothetical protein